jgi:hypothetical protein
MQHKHTLVRVSIILIGGLALGYSVKTLMEAPGTKPVLSQSAAPDRPGPGGGRWFEAPTPQELTPEQQARIEELDALGYLGGTLEASSVSGVTRYDPQRTSQGYNFYVSGHGQEAVLMDMEGTVLHRWSHAFVEPRRDTPLKDEQRDSYYWRRGHLFDNGDILVLHPDIGLRKLDKNSKELWAYYEPLGHRAHHDLQVMDDGTIYLLTRKTRMIPRIHKNKPTVEDFISVINPDGTLRRRISILECLEASPHISFLKRPPESEDIFHTNTLEVLDGRLAKVDPAFRAGNILLSILRLDLLVIVDPAREEVVWARAGIWRQQHQPTILNNGNMLLFDNCGLEADGRRASRVLEYDIATWQLVWQYGDSQDNALYSETCSTAQRLPSGNTLITESDTGRALEVTPDQTVVWEFHNPHRAGDEGQFIAALLELIRLESDFPLHWLPEYAR